MFFDSIYYIFFFFFFFSSQHFKRGGTLAPSMDAPPLVATHAVGDIFRWVFYDLRHVLIFSLLRAHLHIQSSFCTTKTKCFVIKYKKKATLFLFFSQ